MVKRVHLQADKHTDVKYIQDAPKRMNSFSDLIEDAMYASKDGKMSTLSYIRKSKKQ